MKLKIGDVTIAYETEGPRNSVPVLLVHGFPFSKAMWEYQVAALRKDYYVVTYDVRGHGASDPGDGQYTVELFVDDLIALLDHLKLRSVVAVGLSMGGYIILRAAERHPERFRGLVLCDTRSEADGNDGKVKRAGQARELKINGTAKFTDAFLEAVFHGKTFTERPEAVESIREIIGNTPVGAMAGTLIALAGRTDTTAGLYKLNVPTLILVGKHDTLTPPSASHAMKDKISNSELHVIPDAGHLSNMENPEEFTTHLFNFLHKIKRVAS
jgi:3-oxoadipate enol-lactonase